MTRRRELGHPPGGPLTYGQLGSDGNTYVESGGIRVEDGDGNVRVTLGRISEAVDDADAGDFGLVVTNPAGTVIIDGTSNMFKILASGTFAIDGPDGLGGSPTSIADVTLALGLNYTPAALTMIEFASDQAQIGSYFSWIQDGGFSDSYGIFEQIAAGVDGRVPFGAGTDVVASAFWRTSDLYDRSAFSVDVRYYILLEAAF